MNEIICIHASHPSLSGHFPGNPLVPGVVLLAHVIDVTEKFYEGKIQVIGMPAVKFLAPVHPEKEVVLSLLPVAPDSLRFECRMEESMVATGNIDLAVFDH
jgi:3-hydroxyacyl-[acyl-carrier-protein] dehydratase